MGGACGHRREWFAGLAISVAPWFSVEMESDVAYLRVGLVKQRYAAPAAPALDFSRGERENEKRPTLELP